MGVCKYCNKSAGLLRSKHPECEKLYNDGKQEILNEILETIQKSQNFAKLEDYISSIGKKCLISTTEQKSLLIEGWERSVNRFLEDGLLDKSEEDQLARFQEHFGLSQDDLNKTGAYTRVVKAAILRDLLNGIIPEKVSISGDLAINFQKDEKVIWAFTNTHYYEDKIKRKYIGGSHGISIRIAKGLYYRPSIFKAGPVERIERILIDKGILAITNKHLYFVGNNKSFRIPYHKIISLRPYSDGVVIIRDSTSAKPQTFITGDGWFTYNLLINLSGIDPGIDK